jgi:hypothetical protein
MSGLSIKLKTLVTMLQQIESGFAERGIEEVNLVDKDFYLVLSTAEIFDVYGAPSVPLPVGSLIDDWNALTRLAHSTDPFPTAVDVERLGNVLRAVSEVL